MLTIGAATWGSFSRLMRAWIFGLIYLAVCAGTVGVLFAGIGPGMVSYSSVSFVEQATLSSFFPPPIRLQTLAITPHTLAERFGKGFM